MGIALNFTDTYKNRDLFGIDHFDLIDMKDIEGTRGYCTEEAAISIRKRIKDIQPGEIRYLDDGNYHYLSYYFLERIKEPFELIVFDHHTDMQRPGLIDLLSCGSWVLHSLEKLDVLKHVYICGPENSSGEEADISDGSEKIEEGPGKLKGQKCSGTHEQDERVTLAAEEMIRSGELASKVCSGDLPVYISIDLDVLDEKEVSTVWDQGSLRLAELQCCVDEIIRSRHVIGIDICG